MRRGRQLVVGLFGLPSALPVAFLVPRLCGPARPCSKDGPRVHVALDCANVGGNSLRLKPDDGCGRLS
jgi:hypothetical protein